MPADRDASVHAMVERVCFDVSAEEDLARDPRAFFEKHGINEEDARALLDGPKRLPLYRRLIRNNLTGVTERMLSRTRARMTAAFDETFAAFLDEEGPRTHYLRDVPGEFLAWARPKWRARADVPAWAADLAAHELVEYGVSAAAEAKEGPAVAEPSLDRAMIFAEAVRLVRYEFAVHELPGEEHDRTDPPKRATALLVYRDREHAVRFLELTPLAGAVTEQLLMGTTLGAAVQAACATLGVAMDQGALAGVAGLLADFGDRGIVLGAKG